MRTFLALSLLAFLLLCGVWPIAAQTPTDVPTATPTDTPTLTVTPSATPALEVVSTLPSGQAVAVVYTVDAGEVGIFGDLIILTVFAGFGLFIAVRILQKLQ